MKITVLYPDYAGKSPEFYNKVKENTPQGTVILPIYNGLDEQSLDKLVNESEQKGIKSIKSTKKGLSLALMDGYEHCINNYPDSTIVRLDTAEHDEKYINKLASIANEKQALVIGDLSFKDGKLVSNSADEIIHVAIFPQLYKEFAGVPLTCAHGYQAIHPNVLPTIYTGAKKIMNAVSEKIGEKPTWGFDGAMALSAHYQNIPIIVEYVPAMTVRNRETKKIQDQFGRHLQLCLTAKEIFSK